MVEARVEREGFIHNGRRQARDKHVIVSQAIYDIEGPAGSGKLSFVRYREDRIEPDDSQIDATRGAREWANRNGVLLTEVTGTGANGRVTAHDVREFVRRQK